jgi:hypothetical protein
MAQRGGSVHVVTTRRQYKGRVYTTHLLRRSYRDGDKVKNETLGNLSHLPDHVIELVRRSLRGEAFVPAEERFEIIASNPHGDVDTVLQAMRRLDFAALLASRPCREADLVMGMVAARIVAHVPTLKFRQVGISRHSQRSVHLAGGVSLPNIGRSQGVPPPARARRRRSRSKGYV